MRYSLIFLLFIAACGGSTENSDAKATTTSVSTSPAGNFQAPPAISSEKLIDLYENCDYIDFIFPNLPFSISQEEKASIQQTLRHIKNEVPANYNPSCPYFAQQIFQEDGEIVLDAKIFFQEGCTYYLFYEDGKAAYSASFTNEGIAFYNNILAEAEKIRANE